MGPGAGGTSDAGQLPVSLPEAVSRQLATHDDGWSLPAPRHEVVADALSWSNAAPQALKNRVRPELVPVFEMLWDNLAAAADRELLGRSRSERKSGRVFRRVLGEMAAPIAYAQVQTFRAAAELRVPSDAQAKWTARLGGVGAGVAGQTAVVALGPGALIIELCAQTAAALLDDYAAACVRRNRYEHSGRAPTAQVLAGYVAGLHDAKTSAEDPIALVALVEWLIDEVSERTVDSLGLGVGVLYSLKHNTQTVRRALADHEPLPPVTAEEVAWLEQRGAPDRAHPSATPRRSGLGSGARRHWQR